MKQKRMQRFVSADEGVVETAASSLSGEQEGDFGLSLVLHLYRTAVRCHALQVCCTISLTANNLAVDV
eukprot:CAMPEP_0198110014 /NCGR_PEP_ID=MMETSP1442-20131203/2046_1 /TAXON_ID= /ORGANISM="Craspedostauros australis, Strain CCMP3328" /LENGTH=67 /DNA_ID=CAMNT_0043765897 /DNA_START=125 /DNA_END=324 /DNA_ORIENTATION=+